ncbi:P-loop containing nucleoside triphosphate hydrolase protein [Xylaria curta]|nr:P-loop containing nucleoside triphosphate hydrolase protein [Xylaria curta]
MEDTYAFLAEKATEVLRKTSNPRVVISLAGPPGSGKSTIAAEVVKRINAEANQRVAAVLPMDGFHYPRAYLDTLPNCAEAYSRRGTHWTFDANGVASIEIPSEIKIIILEGNWLLFDRDPWNQIEAYMDDTWFVDIDEDLARRRVAERHIKSGIETTWEAALERTNQNDLLNGQEVRRHLIKPSVMVQSIDVSVDKKDH